MRDYASNPNLKIVGFDYVPCEWGEVMLFLSRDIGENLTVVILSHRSRVLQWRCYSFNWKNKKTKRIEKHIIVIDDLKLKLYVSLIMTSEIHGFSSRYNLKQKCIALIPSYNLERENYKDKSNLLTLYLSL